MYTIFYSQSSLSQPIYIRTASPIFPVAGLLLQESRVFQVQDGPAGSGFGEFQVFGDGGDRRPASSLFVSPVGKVDVNSHRPMGQILLIQMDQVPHRFPQLPSFFVIRPDVSCSASSAGNGSDQAPPGLFFTRG